MIIEILGHNAALAGLMGVIAGLTTQIYKNWKIKSCEGLSLLFICLGGYSYFSWLMYGAFKGDIFLVIPQTLGTICMITILFQFWIYRKK